MSHTISEPTFTGYISSTHDALIIFECVRRGIMPKVSRRLRDDERKLIRSGSVFVFDERESGIKRWTDGLLWSPSRILWNFLVYRQIEKRTGKAPERGSNGPLGTPGELALDPLAHGVSYIPGAGTNSGPSSVATSPSTGAFADLRDFGGINSRGRSVSSASDSAASWRNTNFADPRYGHHHPQMMAPSLNSMTGGNFSASVPMAPGSSGSLADRKEADLERALVGSLKSSYPFAKDGLCKKTISIQVEGSTQHLISYYKVDDVRSGRLRTPVSLPEISGLNISPILLNKSNFRNPPDIEFLPDGSVRYRGDGSEASRRSVGTGSGSEGTSGSEGRSMHGSSYSSAVPLSPTTSDAFFPPIGSSGTGFDARLGPQQGHAGGYLPRRLSGTFNRLGRATAGRYEPYAVPSTYGVRGGPPTGIHGTSAQAAPSGWTSNAIQPSRPEAQAASVSRQGWSPADAQQYSRDGLPAPQWQARPEESIPGASHWSSSSGIVRPDSGNSDATFASRPGDHSRLRDTSDGWSQSQLPVAGGQVAPIAPLSTGSEGLPSKMPGHALLRQHGAEASEQQHGSGTADNFPALSSQYGTDLSGNRGFNLMNPSNGYSAPVASSKLHQLSSDQSSFGHPQHQHFAQQSAQSVQPTQQPHAISEYSHGQPQSHWQDTAHTAWQQQHPISSDQSAEADPSSGHVMDASNWTSYSAQSGMPQAEGVLDSRNQNYGENFGPRSGLGTVLLTRPDTSQYRPASSGSFGQH